MFFAYEITCSIEKLGENFACIYAGARAPNSIFIENKEQIYGQMLKPVFKVSELAEKFGGISIKIPLIKVTPAPNQIIVSMYIVFENSMQRLLFFNALSNEIPNGGYVN